MGTNAVYFQETSFFFISVELPYVITKLIYFREESEGQEMLLDFFPAQDVFTEVPVEYIFLPTVKIDN